MKPSDEEVRRIDMYHGFYGEFMGFSFWDNQKNCLFKCGNSQYLIHREFLEVGERIIGVKSRLMDVDLA